jgi:hypothetical protein
VMDFNLGHSGTDERVDERIINLFRDRDIEVIPTGSGSTSPVSNQEFTNRARKGHSPVPRSQSTPGKKSVKTELKLPGSELLKPAHHLPPNRSASDSGSTSTMLEGFSDNRSNASPSPNQSAISIPNMPTVSFSDPGSTHSPSSESSPNSPSNSEDNLTQDDSKVSTPGKKSGP